jgi:RNA polymerase primary sigma factor
VAVPRQGERLTTLQEQELVIRAVAGDPDARRRLVAAFLPAVAALASHFPSGAGVEPQELIQEGVAGLLFAARRYDPRSNTPFWAYASFWVRKAMQELVAELIRPVALSDRAVRSLARVRTARNEHLRAHSSEPTSDELIEATGFTRAQIESLQATEQMPRALGEPLRPGADTTETVGDTIVDPGAEHAYEQVLDEMEIREVRGFADRLDERERAVIQAHYGLGQHAQTLNQIGGALGLTGERARQIENGALKKLRESLTEPARVRAKAS